jgi:hypothetical protein
MTPKLTTFRRSMPSNLLTVREWSTFAAATGKKSWESAARYYASVRGGAHVLRSDGSLRVYTLRDLGLITQSTYREGSWAWD